MSTGDATTYLIETEHAIRHLFAGVEQCEDLLRGLVPPSRAHCAAEVRRYVEAAEVYFDRSFSKAALCGCILQIAFMGLFLYSKNASIPDDCTSLVEPSNNKAIRFCIGRRIHGIPAGLLIYSARNQFNHWDDESFDGPTSRVFAALSKVHYDDSLFDMAYELNYPVRTLRANHVLLNELRWISYEAYITDMRMMFAIH